jgi:hypothetical protein
VREGHATGCGDARWAAGALARWAVELAVPSVQGFPLATFLVWLWLSNTAILLGAELNAELERGRAIAAGHPPDEEPYMELRDISKLRERDNL